jgi:SNF2 family DNA or RNA helicase
MPDWAGSSTKFEAISQLLVEAKVSHKWIIFCHFRHEMQMLEEMLKAESVVEIVQQYHGGLTAAQKEDVLERSLMPIMEGKQEVLLVQLQSGGTGLNLQHFDKIIFTGPWWTKALMDQAVGRAVRIGQTKQVVVYHLHLKAEDADDRLNIDRFMAEKAGAKGALCEKVLQGATTTVLAADL